MEWTSHKVIKRTFLIYYPITNSSRIIGMRVEVERDSGKKWRDNMIEFINMKGGEYNKMS